MGPRYSAVKDNMFSLFDTMLKCHGQRDGTAISILHITS